MQNPRPSPESVKCKIFKQCELKCNKCKDCKEAKKVFASIDLNSRSKHSLIAPRDWR
jgi:hypothetical protein